MHYTLNQLKTFVKICETKSVTKTSEALYLTQPAVSIQLKKFQEQFDLALYEIINKKLYITPFGEEINNACKTILNEVDGIKEKSLAYKGVLTGKLKISIVSTGKYVLPYFLSDFTQKHPGVELSIDVTNKQNVVKNLENNEVDFSLVSVLPMHLKLSKIELMKNELYLVSSIHEKSDSKKILNTKALILREQGSATRGAMERFLDLKKITPKKTYELTSNEAVKQSIIANLGVSVMPIIGIKNELSSGLLKIIKTPGLPITTKWNIVWLKDKKLSPAALALVEHIKSTKEKVIKTHFEIVENH